MESAIKKAIEGGYKSRHRSVDFTVEGDALEHEETFKQAFYGLFLLDPLFWQALFPIREVKCWACKGEKYFEDFFTKKVDKNKPCGNCEETGIQKENDDWKDNWHAFIDHLANNKPIDEFFNNLLN